MLLDSGQIRLPEKYNLYGLSSKEFLNKLAKEKLTFYSLFSDVCHKLSAAISSPIYLSCLNEPLASNSKLVLLLELQNENVA